MIIDDAPTNEQKIHAFVNTTESILAKLTENYTIAVQASARNRFNWVLPDEFKKWEWTLTSPTKESILLVLELTQITPSTCIPTFSYRRSPVPLTAIGCYVDTMHHVEADEVKGVIAKSADTLSKCFTDTPKKKSVLRRQQAGSFRQSSFRHTQKASRISRMHLRLSGLVAPGSLPACDLLKSAK